MTDIIAKSAFKGVQPAEPAAENWLAPWLVGITALGIAVGWLVEQSNLPEVWGLVAHVIAYGAGGFYGIIGAVQQLRRGKVDIDLLMILAALGAAYIGEWREGAILLFLFSLSNVLQDYAIGRSRRAIKSLLKLHPDEAHVRRGDSVQTVPTADLLVGDIVLIEPGERIPVDGVVVAGQSSLDQSPITGESMPVAKGVGDEVYAGTLNKHGALDVRATRPAHDTALARIIHLVETAQDNQAPTERFLERFEERYALFILASIALFIVVPPLVSDVDFQANFYRAMVLMTVASPCALVISVPSAFISAIASAARRGILLKGGAFLELMARARFIALDKTGTLTRGQPSVTHLIAFDGDEDRLLRWAASAESRSEHPLAQAIVQAAQARGLLLDTPADFEALVGVGVRASVFDADVLVGKVPALAQIQPLPAVLQTAYDQFSQQGQTVVGALIAERWAGLIAIADTIRPEARASMLALRDLGIEPVMLTGDHAPVAAAIAREAGIARYYADLLPEDKVTQVHALAEEGVVAMVGDGINDAPALALAHVGIAMGSAGTDVALETADVALMGDRLDRLPLLVTFSRQVRRVVWQNIAFSLFVIVVLVTGVFVVDLPLTAGVLGHEGSTVIVVLNSLLQLLIWPELKRRWGRQAG